MYLGFGWVGLVDDACVQGFDHNVNDNSVKAVGWLWENEHVVLHISFPMMFHQGNHSRG
jgi:hypothetical protein